MSDSPRIGILVAQKRWPSLVEQVRLVEELGFSQVWLGDDYINPFEDCDWLDAWVALAGLAEATEDVRLGTLITSIVYRHPAVIAKQAITVDHISGGRFELGIGAGGIPSDHLATGTPMWSGRERQERLAEFVELVDHLLREGRTTFAGKHYAADVRFNQPRPVQTRLRLTVAAHGPRSMRVAARYADTWSVFLAGDAHSEADAAAQFMRWNEGLDKEARAAGREPASIRRSVCFGYTPGLIPESVDEALRLIELYAGAGMNEFVFNYTPGQATIEMPEGGGPMPQLLTSPERLAAFAAKVL